MEKSMLMMKIEQGDSIEFLSVLEGILKVLQGYKFKGLRIIKIYSIMYRRRKSSKINKIMEFILDIVCQIIVVAVCVLILNKMGAM